MTFRAGRTLVCKVLLLFSSMMKLRIVNFEVSWTKKIEKFSPDLFVRFHAWVTARHHLRLKVKVVMGSWEKGPNMTKIFSSPVAGSFLPLFNAKTLRLVTISHLKTLKYLGLDWKIETFGFEIGESTPWRKGFSEGRLKLQFCENTFYQANEWAGNK